MYKYLTKIVLCHLVGDYVLQGDYLAMNKGKDWYILFVHSALYCIPFILVFGFSKASVCLLMMHFIVDMFKARYNALNIAQDQSLHYLAAILFYIDTVLN